MLTVTKLAHRCGLSRSTVLYYESIGLLKPAIRTGANYRLYGDKDFERLRQICVYRNAGLNWRTSRRFCTVRRTMPHPFCSAGWRN